MTSSTLINPDGNVPHKKRLGRCYELAGNLALHNPETQLIHGSIQGFGAPRIPHAWVVLPDGSIWEPATNKVWEKPIFYGFFNAIVRKRYDQQTFMRMMVRHEHWGPWDNPEAVEQPHSLADGCLVPSTVAPAPSTAADGL
jgi:hypothetical protein